MGSIDIEMCPALVGRRCRLPEPGSRTVIGSHHRLSRPISMMICAPVLDCKRRSALRHVGSFVGFLSLVHQLPRNRRGLLMPLLHLGTTSFDGPHSNGIFPTGSSQNPIY